MSTMRWAADMRVPGEYIDPKHSLSDTNEKQIMSTLLAALGLDDTSSNAVDFGTLAVFTCEVRLEHMSQFGEDVLIAVFFFPKHKATCSIPPAPKTFVLDGIDDAFRPPQGFAEEVVWKQDFSQAGVEFRRA
jgi:hypothetical protein